MNVKEVLYLGIFLFVLGGLAGLALSGVYVFTEPRIAAEKQIILNAQLKEILPAADYFVASGEGLYLGYKNGSAKKTTPLPVGQVWLTQPMGYAGIIEMLVGISKNKIITGIRILSMKETPGLGTKALAPQFLQQFVGKSKADKIEPKQDIDAITGATITTRAVCTGAQDVLKKP